MLKSLMLSVPVVALASSMALAGQAIDVAATMACVNDKWTETEPEKGHKFAEYAGRCVVIPNDSNEKTYVEDCAGNYEFMSDGSWKGGGTCSVDLKAGDTISLTWEEGSHLKDYTYAYTGGTGKYKGAKGGGTYKTEELTTTLYGGRKKGSLELLP